jgi:predicted transcriptional regulator
VCLAFVCLLLGSALPFLAAATPGDEDRSSDETWAAWIDSISTPKTTYDAGETIDATVTVERGPDMLTAVWEGTLVLAVQDAFGDTVHDDDLHVAINVGGQQQTSSFTFDLAEAGDYLLELSLYRMNDTMIDRKGLNISVVDLTPPPGDQRASIDSMETDKTVYQVGDVLDVTVTVKRSDDMLDDVWEGTLVLQLLDIEMDELGSWEGAVSLPYGGFTQDLSFTIDLTEAGPRLLVATLNWIDGAFVDEERLNVTVAAGDGNQAPIAIIDPGDQTVGVTDVARFDGSLSHDDGRITSYLWDLGDGTFIEGPTVTHIYRVPGIFNVTLTVTDDDGAVATARGAVQVLAFLPPPEKEAWIDSVTAKETVNQSEPTYVTVDVVRGGDVLDYVWTGTLTLEVLINGTVQTLTEAVELATGGETRSYTFAFVLTDPVDHMVRVRLFGQDGELVDVEDILITVVGGVVGPEDRGLPDVPATAVAAAGVLVILGALAATEVGKWSLLGLLVPLYSKLKKEDVLEHFTRGKIYGYIMANPGDHYNSIQKTLDIPNGTFAYHLRVLEKEGYIRSARYGTNRCFFPANMNLPPEEGVLRAGQKLIVDKILEEPGISQKQIASSLGVSSATVNYHVKDLLKLGLVETERKGMRLKYYVNCKFIPSPC